MFQVVIPDYGNKKPSWDSNSPRIHHKPGGLQETPVCSTLKQFRQTTCVGCLNSPSIICSGKLKIFTPDNLGRGSPYNQRRECQAAKMRVAKFVSRKFFSWLAWKMTLSTNISFPKALLKVIFLFPRWVSKVPTPPRRRCDTRSRRYNTSPVRNDHFFCLKHLWKGDVFSKIWWILETNSVLTMRVGLFPVLCVITFLFGGVIWLLYTESPLGTYHISSRSKRISSEHS